MCSSSNFRYLPLTLLTPAHLLRVRVGALPLNEKSLQLLHLAVFAFDFLWVLVWVPLIYANGIGAVIQWLGAELWLLGWDL